MSEEITVIVMQGTKKIPIIMEDEQTIEILHTKITEVTEIPPHYQKLICKGRSLIDKTKSMSELGIKNKTRIMLIGKKVNLENSPHFKEMRLIESKIMETESRVTAIKEEMKSAEKGFVPDEHIEMALTKFNKRIASASEEFTRHLESLDSLELKDEAPELRTQRKGLVNRLQTNLDNNENLQTSITEMKKKGKT